MGGVVANNEHHCIVCMKAMIDWNPTSRHPQTSVVGLAHFAKRKWLLLAIFKNMIICLDVGRFLFVVAVLL
jgi:hypothetical protein